MLRNDTSGHSVRSSGQSQIPYGQSDLIQLSFLTYLALLMRQKLFYADHSGSTPCLSNEGEWIISPTPTPPTQLWRHTYQVYEIYDLFIYIKMKVQCLGWFCHRHNIRSHGAEKYPKTKKNPAVLLSSPWEILLARNSMYKTNLKPSSIHICVYVFV